MYSFGLSFSSYLVLEKIIYLFGIRTAPACPPLPSKSTLMLAGAAMAVTTPIEIAADTQIKANLWEVSLISIVKIIILGLTFFFQDGTLLNMQFNKSRIASLFQKNAGKVLTVRVSSKLGSIGEGYVLTVDCPLKKLGQFFTSS